MKAPQLHPGAKAEMRAAARRYESEKPGLAGEFLAAIRSGIHRIAADPERWPIFEEDFRRLVLPRFPYSLIYRIRRDSIIVLAVMHQRRKPGYWLSRGT